MMLHIGDMVLYKEAGMARHPQLCPALVLGVRERPDTPYPDLNLKVFSKTGDFYLQGIEYGEHYDQWQKKPSSWDQGEAMKSSPPSMNGSSSPEAQEGEE